MFMIVSEVYMPKLSGSFGPSFRSDRRATRASSIVRSICIGSRGFTVSSRLRREPNSFWKAPSGITMNSSCELPKSDALLLVDADHAEVDAA